MRWHTTNYKHHDHETGVPVNRGWWLDDLPRLILACRLFGHRPVVDGYGPHKRGLDARRWVVCDRCGVRPDPHGNLDPDEWAIGEPYTEPIWKDGPSARFVTSFRKAMPQVPHHVPSPPGAWPARPTGSISGQMILGRHHGLLHIGLDIGAAGDEDTLAFRISINPLFWFSVQTEGFGQWLQRRLIPTGYETRQIGVLLDGWQLHWKLWARQGHWSRDQPKWWEGSVNLDLAERLFGPKRYAYTNAAGPELAWVHLPEGDSYQVQLRLKRERFGRPKSRRPAMSWSVEWESDRPIPVRHRHDGKSGGITSAAVAVADDAVTNNLWVTAACAQISATVAEQRTRYDYRPKAAEEGDNR
ncbi:hypothetical protein AB0K21_21940 [Streptosporangium sp. NPDC049248]|uniref:hypothetical protein n=1 Tax=Streptosporangium sp. NPDC049248 TaxID=3155651 RepID=UPI003422A167